MKRSFLLVCLLALGLTGCSNAQISGNKTPRTVMEDHALPMLASWNSGGKTAGFSPAYQIGLIEKGHHLLLGFAFPNVTSTAADIEKKRVYYETPLRRAAELKLPITLIGTQWEQVLYQDKKYFDLPPDQNPNVVTPDGKIEKKLSPFGPVEPWREAGAAWASSPLMKQVQEWYPDPPRVILLSNNEAGKLTWKDVETDARYVAQYGKGRDDDFKRKVVADGWIERYRALQEGMRDALSKSWQSKVLFVGYGAFGGAAFGRWPGWINYSIATPGRIDPNPLMWDGGTPPYYTATYNGLRDFQVMSPQIEAMNWVFMQKQALRLNPNFQFGFSVWDGHTDVPEKDLRITYEKLGQKYSPARYGGYAQFGLWLLRPHVMREYSGYTSHGWTDDLTEIKPYTQALMDDVDHIYSNDTLKYFWRKGELVPNRAHQHPYQTAIPDEYKNVDRWFLLDTNLDAPRPWKLDTQIPVFSLALVTGEKGNRRWLVYAHSPLQDRQNVEIIIPDYGKITVDVPVAGAFYEVDEKIKKIQTVS